MVLSLTARGLITGEISAHFAEVYGARVSKDTVSAITDTVLEEMTEWCNRPLESGRFPLIVASPVGKGFACRGMRPNRMSVAVKRCYFELIRTGLAGSAAAAEVGVAELWVGESRAGQAIARRIGKSYQTVYREIARNRKPDGRYQPWYAHNQAYLRKVPSSGRKGSCPAGAYTPPVHTPAVAGHPGGVNCATPTRSTRPGLGRGPGRMGVVVASTVVAAGFSPLVGRVSVPVCSVDCDGLPRQRQCRSRPDGRTGMGSDPAGAGLSWPAILDEVTGALEGLAQALDEADDLTVLLSPICAQVVRVVPGVDAATVTLLDGDEPCTAAATDEAVAALDREQFASGHGPCVQAVRTGELVRVAVAEAEDRWPRFTRDARAVGMGSFLCAPLMVNHSCRAAVNCYGANGHGFADVDAQLLELYTTAVEAALRSHTRYQQAREQIEQLRAALETRAVIDQAKGILMAAHGITAADAFTLLVEQSQRDNIKLRDLAHQFVVHACQPEGSQHRDEQTDS
jgi:hypothetical protein